MIGLPSNQQTDMFNPHPPSVVFHLESSHNRVNKTKTNFSYSLKRTRTCAYQRVQNVRFSENLARFAFLVPRF